MPTRRIASLDGLRAFSILVVLFGHLAGTRHFPLQALYRAADYADVAVRAFFVISGFLITTLLLRDEAKCGTIHLKEFYIRRAYRILPASYIYMAVVSITFHATLSVKDIVLAFTYLTSYSWYRPWILGHLWSLSVEEQFYFVWPVVMAMGIAISRQVALGAIILAPVLRFVFIVNGLRGNGSYFPTVADALATGCLLALLQPALAKYRSFFEWRGFPLIWAFTLSIPLLARHARIFAIIGLPLLHAGLALCMQNAIAVKYRVLNTRPIIWIGTLSYSLYLWQQLFLDRYSPEWYTGFPVNIALVFVAGTISYYLVEQPALRLRAERKRGTSQEARVSQTETQTR